MTPQEIVDMVESRFPVMMYDGYRENEPVIYNSGGTEPADESDFPLLWPKELKAVLLVYSRKAAIKTTVYVEAEEIDSVTQTIDLPTDFMSLDMCADVDGSFIRTQRGSRFEDPDTIKTLKLIPIVPLDELLYPIRLSYFINLDSYSRDQDLPDEIDVDLIMDYFEALVGVPNTQLCKAVGSVDIDIQQKEIPEYEQQKRECEEKFANIRSLPSATATF